MNEEAMRDARELHDRLTKPRRSLGRLEDIGVRLAGIAGRCPPPVPEPATVTVFAGDHGVVAEGVTPWPQEVPPFPVIIIRVGDGAPPPWANHRSNRVITIEDPAAKPGENGTRRRWR